MGGTSGEVNGLGVEPDGTVWLAGVAGRDFLPTSPTLRRGRDFLVRIEATGSSVMTSARLPWGLAGQNLARGPRGELIAIGGDGGFVSAIDLEARPAPVILGVTNAAAGPVTSVVAPGELLSIYGISLTPVDPARAAASPNGLLPTSLNGVRVLF